MKGCGNVYRLYLIRAEIIKLKEFKTVSVVNILLSVVSIGVQLSILRLFVTDSTLWESTIVYSITALGINQVIVINKVPVYADSMISGNIVKYYVKPIKILNSIFYEELGNAVLNSIQVFPFFVVSIVCSWLYTGTLLVGLVLFVISFGLGVVLSVLVCTSFYTITFYITNHQSVKALLVGVMSFLSGSMVPLILFPEKLQSIVSYTPFALVVDTPIKFLIGTYGVSELRIVVYQIIWIAIFYIVCSLLINFFEKKGSFYGG